MQLFQDILIFVAKILIFIGDLVLLALSPIFKIFKQLQEQSRRNIEHEIFSQKKARKTNLKLPELVLPEVRFPNLNFKFSLPNLDFPRYHLPVFERPRIQFPKFKLPSFHFPKIEPYQPDLPRIRLRRRHRGRPRLPTVLPFRTRFKYVFYGTILSFFFIFLPIVFVIFIQNLPNPAQLSLQDISQSTKIYDRNKVLLYQIYANQNRTNVSLTEIPQIFKEATIAIEDKNFYTTPGFDILAIVRSAIADIKGEPLQGGSTITQQLIKARLLTPERSIERKIKELILAVWAERIYSKDEILEMYFNQVPYGGTAWGAQAAAQTYFGKNVKDLNLSESAFLAGIPQAPTIYSPYSGEKDAWKRRQKEVLANMVEAKFITQQEADEAASTKLTFRPHQQILHAPHFVMYVKELLIDKYGLSAVERGGLTVITSLDLKTQEKTQKIVTEEVENGSHLNFSNAAALITNPKNGDIIAMVGGKDYYDPNGGNYNVTTALRQPGSTIKAVTYSAALLNGFTAATPIDDSPVRFAIAGSTPYSPVNYDGRFHGRVTLRQALGNSINIPAVKTLNQIGVPTMVGLAQKLGITYWGEPEEYGLALTLGAAEVRMVDLAVVYATLANGGEKVDLNPFLKITNYQGQVLEEKNEVKGKKVLPEEVAYIISNILSDNNARSMAFGLNSPLRIPGHTVSVKTGTTDNKRDNWTIGYTPDLLTAVWVGNNDNTPMNPIFASGISGAAPIWNKIMNTLLAGKNPKDEVIPLPKDLVVKPCGGRNEYFIKGTENIGGCRPLSINDRPPQERLPQTN